MSKKVVLITGTNSGFGYLAAKTLAAEGHSVYATIRETKGRNAERANELAGIENIQVLELDVTDREGVKKVVSEVIEKAGRLDVLVNNAGFYGGGITETFTEDDLERMFDVNLKGVWRLTKAGLPQMRKQNEGLIINISSGLGRFSAPFMTVYNSTKFALEGLTEGLHYELKPLGVDVVMIQPGAFPTEIFGKTAAGSDAAIAQQYGDLAKVPEQIGEGMGQLFETVKPDPQMVPNAISQLIAKPKGQRPLRTVVDPATGNFVEDANQQVKVQYDYFLTAFGMQDLLN